MDLQNKTTVMSQKIFNIGLSVDTVSVYLLCCSLTDSDTVISTKNLYNMWNSTKETLNTGLKDLEKRNIIRGIISDREDKTVYKLTDEKEWIFSVHP